MNDVFMALVAERSGMSEYINALQQSLKLRNLKCATKMQRMFVYVPSHGRYIYKYNIYILEQLAAI